MERSRNKKEKKKEEKIQYVKEIGDYDPEELAETMVLGRKMLRKRNREDIIDASYNKYAYDEDDHELPDWLKLFYFRFKEDELKHRFSIMPITKAEVDEEKRKI